MSDYESGWAEPDAFTGPLFEQLKRHPKRIVFSDGEDERVVLAAAKMVEMEIGVPILLGQKPKIVAMAEKLGVKMTFINVIDPAKADDLAHFATMLERIERLKGNTISNAREVLSQPHFFAAMMIQYGQADGMVGGNLSHSESIFRALIQMVSPMPKVPHVFGAAVMVSDRLANFGPDGILFLADCGIADVPNIQELSASAVQTGRLAQHYLGRRVRVAMLSHSTMNSSARDSAARVRAATELARAEVMKNRYDIEVDGELEADVALDPKSAEHLVPQMKDRKRADVLVFPNLDAAQISMKLLRHLGGATKYGQFVLGLNRPAAQVPLTATPRILLGTAAAVGAEAIKFHDMFPDG